MNMKRITTLLLTILTLSAAGQKKFSQLPIVTPSGSTAFVGVNQSGSVYTDGRITMASLLAYLAGASPAPTLQAVLTAGNNANQPIFLTEFGKNSITMSPSGILKVSDTSGHNYFQIRSLFDGSGVTCAAVVNSLAQTFYFFPTATRNDTFPDASGKIALTNQIPNMQGGTTAGLINAASAAVYTVTWPVPFADANYAVTCSVEDTTNSASGLTVIHIKRKTTANIQVIVNNTSLANLVGTVNAIAKHD